MVKSLFGADLPEEQREISRSMLAVLDAASYRLNRPLRIPSWIPTGRNLRERHAIEELDSMLRALLTNCRESGGRDGLLSMLVAAVDEDSGARMSDGQLRDEMMTLFLAGHETNKRPRR